MLLKILNKIRSYTDPLVRDFTEDAEEEMISITNEVNCDENIVDKYIVDPIGRWLDKKGILEMIYGVDSYQKGIIDCYNYSAQNIRDICGMARNYDKSYGRSIGECAEQSENVVFLVKNLAECIDTDSKYYAKDEPISKRLFGFFSKEFDGLKVIEVAKNADELDNTSLKELTIEKEDVVEYCSDEENVGFFEDYNDYIFEEVLDFSKLDIVFLASGSVVYKGVEMTVTQLIAILSKEGYNEKMVREQLNQIISSVISANSGAQAVMKEYKAAKETLEELIKKYLEDENQNSAFKSFVEAMGGITAVKQLAEDCPQLIDYLFSDYSKGLEILDDIEGSCNSPEMIEAIARLRTEYNNKWIGVLQKTKDFSSDMIAELTEKGLKDWIKEEVGDSTVLLSLLDIAGAEKKVDGTHKMIALRKISEDLQDSYEDALEKINSGNYTEEDVARAENAFNMLKETSKEIYKTYIEMSDDPDKQIWANKQLEKLERVTMKSYTRYGFDD